MIMKSNNPHFTREAALAAGYRYEPETGRLFKGEKELGIVWPKKPERRKKQYMRVSIFSRTLQRSRAAWLLMTGEWPAFELDHKDTDSLNDKWENLRPATRMQNEVNKGRYRNNRSGLKGAWKVRKGLYKSAIRRAGIRVYLGQFPTAEAAHAAYLAVAKQVDGEFLRAA